MDPIPEDTLRFAQGRTVPQREHRWRDTGTQVGTGGSFALPFEDDEIKWTREPPPGAICLATPMPAASSYEHTIRWEFRKGGR